MSSPPLDMFPFLEDYRIDTIGGDRTSQITVPPDLQISAYVVSRQPIVTAAVELIERLPEKLRLAVIGTAEVSDGLYIDEGHPLGVLRGNARQILGLERTLLNGLQLLCGIATTTSQWVEALPANVILLDTRKTHATLRSWERLAVRCGGASNHRFNLADIVMIKDNHIAAAGGLESCVRRAAQYCGHASKVICEVETLEQAEQAVAAGANGLLIDNNPIADWPAYWDAIPDHISLEFSGGIVWENLRHIPTPPREVHISTSQTVMGARPVDIGLDVSTAGS